MGPCCFVSGFLIGNDLCIYSGAFWGDLGITTFLSSLFASFFCASCSFSFYYNSVPFLEWVLLFSWLLSPFMGRFCQLIFRCNWLGANPHFWYVIILFFMLLFYFYVIILFFMLLFYFLCYYFIFYVTILFLCCYFYFFYYFIFCVVTLFFKVLFYFILFYYLYFV